MTEPYAARLVLQRISNEKNDSLGDHPSVGAIVGRGLLVAM